MQHGLKIAQYVVFYVVYPLKICWYFIGFLTLSLNLDKVNLEILRLYLRKVVEMQISKRKTPANAGVLFWQQLIILIQFHRVSNGFTWKWNHRAKSETLYGVLGTHKGYQIVPLLLADFHHIFHPVEETLIKIYNECHFGIILCRSVGIVLCDLFFA